MHIVHQPYLLTSGPMIAALLPAVAAASCPDQSADHRAQVYAASAAFLETAVQFLDGQVEDTALAVVLAQFYSQMMALKGTPAEPIQAPPIPRRRTLEEMDAEIAAMVSASRERLRNNPAIRRFFS
jgi:hypothetical protein